jgi:transketolase
MYENKEMRQIFGSVIEEMMEKDERIVVIDVDLAKANGTMKLRDKFPERAFDVGIAESNAASIAAGMASYGFIPFVTTFTPFATRRMCDQIAISVTYAARNVKIVGTDPGVSAELNGGTHMSMEDIGVLRSIPNMVIFEPVDNMQLAKSLPQIVDYDGVVYIRMFRKTAPAVFGDDYKFDLFKADTVREGKDVTLFASGIMVAESIKAADILKAEGIDAEIINIHTIKPIDREAVIKSASKTGAVVTCENHNVIGGLKSAVAEVLIEECLVPLKAIGIQDHFGEVGKIDYLKKKYHMTADDIVAAAKEVISKKR